MTNAREPVSMPTVESQFVSSSMNRLKRIAFFSYDDQDALATLRLLGPAKVAGWEVLRGYNFEDREVHLEVVDQADLVLIQRDFCRDYETYSSIKSLLTTQKKPLVFDLDDNLFEIPSDHFDRMNGYYIDALLPIFMAVMDADLITVATDPLRDYLSPFNPSIKVIPNYLDDTIWNITTNPQPINQLGKLTIGFMGGETHRPDIRMILPVLIQLLEKYPGRIQYHFWGIDAPKELGGNSLFDWFPVYFTNYAEFASAFQAIKADILIAPLCDNTFNSCKSVIKFLEYGAVGIPGVYSRVTPYAKVIDDGTDGFLASELDEWFDKLCRLVESPGLRTQMAINAQNKIQRDWLLSRNYGQRIKIYEELLSKFHPREANSAPFYRLHEELSKQYCENALRKDAKIKYLQDKVNDQEKKTAELEEEVLSYLLSRSWRLTHPFRAFTRLVKRFRNA